MGSFAAGVVVTLVAVMLGLRQPDVKSTDGQTGPDVTAARSSPVSTADSVPPGDCEERMLRREAAIYRAIAEDQARTYYFVRYAWLSELDAGRSKAEWNRITALKEFSEWGVIDPYGTEILPKMADDDKDIAVLRSTVKEFRETIEKVRAEQAKIQYRLLVDVIDPARKYFKVGDLSDNLFPDAAKK